MNNLIGGHAAYPAATQAQGVSPTPRPLSPAAIAGLHAADEAHQQQRFDSTDHPTIVDCLRHAVRFHDQLTPSDIATYRAALARAGL